MKKSVKKTNKPKPVLVNFVLDETGSMGICKEATIKGFNEYVGTLKKDKKQKVEYKCEVLAVKGDQNE